MRMEAMDNQEIVALGRQMGLEGKDLAEWVSEERRGLRAEKRQQQQDEQERLEKQKEDEKQKEQAIGQAKRDTEVSFMKLEAGVVRLERALTVTDHTPLTMLIEDKRYVNTLMSSLTEAVGRLDMLGADISPEQDKILSLIKPLEELGKRIDLLQVEEGLASRSQRVPVDVHAEATPPSPSVSTSNSTIVHSDLKMDKMSLPTFSGHRKDWPEFKAVWKALTETADINKVALAHQLKKSLKGESAQRVKAVYVTKPEAYDTIWRKLEAVYGDTSASVQAAMESIQKLKPVPKEEHRKLIELVDEVEAAYSQLDEMGQLNLLSMRDVDYINSLLPTHLKYEWNKLFHDMGEIEKLSPFKPFMAFLERERDTVMRLGDKKPDKKKEFAASSSHHTQARKFFKCAHPSHARDGIKHSTQDCTKFAGMTRDEQYQALKNARACFICFGNHRKSECDKKVPCSRCNQGGHHPFLCKLAQNQVESSHAQTTSAALYPIVCIPCNGKTLQAFFDGGSNASYITHAAADRVRAKRLADISLDITTMGNGQSTVKTRQYQVTLVTKNGHKENVVAFGMDRITNPVSKLDERVLEKLFPGFETRLLQRRSKYVDILIGGDYFGLHPKTEVAKAGEHLSIMSGELGVCLQGAHPDLKDSTSLDANLAQELHEVQSRVTECCLTATHPEFERRKQENFIMGEELATETNPKCGGCRCGKCPIVGQTYSFKEEQELKMIQHELVYDEQNACWITGYPWLVDPHTLPNNYGAALGTLRSLEAKLTKDPDWAHTYSSQIQDMLDRGVARKLSQSDIQAWQGPVFYISHLAVINQHSQSTPVRIVFNSSQVSNGVSLNSCLAKGPDCYLNNLVGILLRWREEDTAAVGDIRKMFHSVHLKPLEQHCHRFLWRDLDTTKPPDTYIMERVNFGDTPAPAICSEAIYQTANRFREDSPEAADLLKKSTYVDDLIHSFPTKQVALRVTSEVEAMLEKGGFKVKCWQFSGESCQAQSMLKGTEDNTRVLGLGWKPKEDVIVFEVKLNFSKKKRGIRSGPNLKQEEVPRSLPTVYTRRIVLEQVMGMYDPLGLISPYTLWSKIHLRETWTQKLGWDEPLPDNMKVKWVNFFVMMFELEKLKLDRSLHPPDAVGDPWLVILSDGSDLAYGFAAYIRWQLSGGGFWCRLMMAKCRIAPINKLSTPQMELNAAVLSKRGRRVIEQESRFRFKKILHIVDSETVLSMINKTSTRFKVYEGVRIGEIQAATKGDMTCWAWMSGKHNTADWLTRGRKPQDLDSDSNWWQGPAIMYKPIDQWGLKYGLQREDSLPGEKKILSCAATEFKPALLDYSRFSDINRVIWVIARIRNAFKQRSFKGGRSSHVTPQDLREAENLIVKNIQATVQSELVKKDRKGKSGGQFARLNPVKDADGMWVVGARMTSFNAMVPAKGDIQKLLVTSHKATRLFMERAHRDGHGGRDATLAKFRQQYWVPHGDKLARSVKHHCQLCRLREVTLLQQKMGPLPEARLKPAPPFNKVMVDLFGPYSIRGEVQKRTSGKAYGVIFTDLVMRAVHIEGVFGYDTSSFLMALSRFASMRGWPETMYSDQGTQLVGADKELREAWQALDHSVIHRHGAEKGMSWRFGPADSPWHQGAVESLVKLAKKALHYAVHNQRLSASEFLTICTEVSNLLNERPIGLRPKEDSDISILTPNCLLMGRATAKNPGGWQPYRDPPQTRYHLVQVAIDQFWQKWVQLYAPGLVVQQKWSTASRNLRPGDVVMVADQNVVRGEYRLGLVKEVFPGADGRVRRVSLTYKQYKVGERVQEYHGANDVVVTRSVQRLALLVPVDYDYEHAETQFQHDISTK